MKLIQKDDYINILDYYTTYAYFIFYVKLIFDFITIQLHINYLIKLDFWNNKQNIDPIIRFCPLVYF